MSSIWQDLCYGARQLARNPGFTAVAVLTLALGIGANTALFSLTNAVLLRPLPASNSDELVRLYTVRPDGSRQRLSSYPDYVDYRDQNRVLAGLVATHLATALYEHDGTNAPMLGEVVSGNYFLLLGVSPLRGRAILPGDNLSGGPGVVVLSYRTWQGQFGGQEDVLGTVVSLNGDPFTVVGIAPREFLGTFAGLNSAFWVPIRPAASWLGAQTLADRAAARFHLIARRLPNVEVQQAQAGMTTLARQLSQANPGSPAVSSVELVPGTLVHGSLRGPIAAFLALISALAALVLLTACLNLATLLVVRTMGRKRELAIRLALGAGRGRLVRFILAEGLLLALLAGVAGIVVSVWIGDAFHRFNPIPSVPLQFEFSLDWRVLSFGLGLSLAAGLALGVAPALQGSRLELTSNLRSEQGTAGGAALASRTRNVFVMLQVAISMLLLVVAGLFLRSLQNAESTDLGFDPSRMLAMDLDLQPLGYSEAGGRQFYEQVLERVVALPGVEAVALADRAPPDISTPHVLVRIDDVPVPAGEPGLRISAGRVSPGYFRALRIALMGGRDFSTEDTAAARRVVIVNETAAQRFWPGREPVGRTIWLVQEGRSPTPDVELEVIGVAHNSKLRTLGEEPEPHLYLSFAQHFTPGMALLVRTTGEPAPFFAEVQRELHALDRAVQGFFPRTLMQHLGFSLLPARLAGALSTCFGLLAAFLSVLGVYGLVSQLVVQRTREIGIRMALGAEPGDVARLLVRKGMRAGLVGVAVGGLAALATTHILASMLYGVNPTDPAVFAAVAGLVLIVLLLACYLPARRAMRVDPMTALRYE